MSSFTFTSFQIVISPHLEGGNGTAVTVCKSNTIVIAKLSRWSVEIFVQSIAKKFSRAHVRCGCRVQELQNCHSLLFDVISMVSRWQAENAPIWCNTLLRTFGGASCQRRSDNPRTWNEKETTGFGSAWARRMGV